MEKQQDDFLANSSEFDNGDITLTTSIPNDTEYKYIWINNGSLIYNSLTDVDEILACYYGMPLDDEHASNLNMLLNL